MNQPYPPFRAAAAPEAAALWRRQFPALAQRVNGRPLAYLDNAATMQRPRCVIEAVARFYERDNANVHRGVHALSQRATAAYEQARAKVRGFLNAERAEEIVFVRGATEAINLVAHSFALARLGPGDEIVVTAMEHHSNIVPWQQACARAGARLRVAPIDDRGELLVDEFERLLGPRTRLAAVAHVSNALGTVNDVARLVAGAHARGVPVLVDGAQAVAHLPVDVRALDCDFYVFSGHKCCGPTGIGALYGKRAWLEQMPPWQMGGDMIRAVSFERTEFLGVPQRFEAGTPDIAGAIGLGAAVDFVARLGLAEIAAYEETLLDYAATQLGRIPGVRIVGRARHKSAILSFAVEGVHPHDVGSILDQDGVAIRTGHHCAMPVMERLGLSTGTARASFAFYNTLAEADRLAAGVRRVRRMFQ